jgi:hypothetical protein
MEQGEFLPEGQVLEREVGAGSERRAQGAQRSDHEEHCRHGSHAAGSSSSLGTGFWQTTISSVLYRLTYRVPGSKKSAKGDAIAIRGKETIRACARKRRSLWLQPVSRRQ